MLIVFGPPKGGLLWEGKKIGQLVPLKSVLHLKLAEAVSSHIRKSSILRRAHGRRAQKVQRWPGVVFVMGAFAEMSGDVSRICVTIAHELARTSASHYNDHAKRTKGMYIRSPGSTRRIAVGPVAFSTAPGASSSTARRTAAPTARRRRLMRTTSTATSSLTREGGQLRRLARRAQPLLLLSRFDPPLRGAGGGMMDLFSA